jgi:AraC-like DNA-binding protein
MSATLATTISGYLSSGHQGVAYSIDDEISIIENPSFDILPNHPYHSPLVVAVYCQAGSGRGRINAKTYNLEPGGFFIVLPGQITEMVNVSEDFRAVYILMSEHFTESLSIGNTFDLRNIVIENPYTLLEERARQAFEGYLSMCMNIMPIEQHPHRLEILRLITRAFFLGMGYFLHDHHRDDREQTRQESITSEFIRLVEDNYRAKRDLVFYAERMGLTSKYLSTVVKSSSGKSAVEWIEKYVTLDAKTQLTSTERTIKQIAYDLNFPSQSFFGKYFARVVGLSPQAYRAKHRR